VRNVKRRLKIYGAKRYLFFNEMSRAIPLPRNYLLRSKTNLIVFPVPVLQRLSALLGLISDKFLPFLTIYFATSTHKRNELRAFRRLGTGTIPRRQLAIVPPSSVGKSSIQFIYVGIS